MDETQVLKLNVTNLQMEAIRHFFIHNDWEFEPQDSDHHENGGRCTPVSQGVNKETQTDPSKENAAVDDDNIGDFVILHDDNRDECPFCLSKPCITDESNRQLWWETESSVPHQRNSNLRKDKYKRFWTMLLHRRVWNDPRYIERKSRALEHDMQGQEWHRRDIMPTCVVNLVRSWLPNPKDYPYMGHLWE